MLVELLHTVRISIRSHSLFVEPFLVIGLIAIIRRTLVLTLQAEDFTRSTAWSADIQSHFQAAMIEGVMLALLISVLVASIYVIRKTKPSSRYSERRTPVMMGGLRLRGLARFSCRTPRCAATRRLTK